MSIHHALHHRLLPVLLLVSIAFSLGSAPAFAATVAKIVLTTPSRTLRVGHHETLRAVAKDAAGHTVTGVKFTWTSSRKTNVRIGTTGVATALKAGTSTIKVTGGGKSASVIITVPTPTAAAGVAAMGAPLAGATITLVDKNGKTLSTATDVDGGYTLDTTGLSSPFLVRVQTDTTTLYSVSDAAIVSKVINVTPLTDLIIRSWYSVQGKDIATAFAHPSTNPPPSPTEVQIIGNVVVQVTALWLQQAGVDTTNFSFISTPFTADSTGVDAVLDATSIDTDTGTVTITDGAGTTQDSTVTYGDGAMTVDTSTTSPGGDSSSETGTVVATTTTMQAALTGITAALNSFTSTVNSKGSALKDTDILVFLDTKLINEGLTKTQFAAATADQFRGLTLSFQILSINSLDTANGQADVSFTASASEGDATQTETVEFFFKKQSDGSWRFYGDQLPAHLSVQAEMRTNQGAFSGDNGPDINVDVRPIKNAYTGITIDDNGLGVFTDTALDKQGTEVDTFTPNPATPGTTVVINRDEFFANSGVLVDLVAAGTPLTLTLTPTGGGAPKVYTVKTNAFTTEAIHITTPTASGIADANLGGTLHVEWTLPTTFAIAEVKLGAQVFDGDQTQNTTNSCEADEQILSTTSTSTDVTLPTTCAGNPVVQANLNVSVTGVNGERETIIYMFSGASP